MNDENLHPLQQCLRDNGDLIAAEATITQQAQLIGHLTTELDELKAEIENRKDIQVIAFDLFGDISKALGIDPKEVEDPHSLVPVIHKLTRELATWQANHADMVERNAILRERPDLPVDRIPAFERLISLQAENRGLKIGLKDVQQLLNDQLDANLALHGLYVDIGDVLDMDPEERDKDYRVLVDAIEDMMSELGEAQKRIQLLESKQ